MAPFSVGHSTVQFIKFEGWDFFFKRSEMRGPLHRRSWRHQRSRQCDGFERLEARVAPASFHLTGSITATSSVGSPQEVSQEIDEQHATTPEDGLIFSHLFSNGNDFSNGATLTMYAWCEDFFEITMEAQPNNININKYNFSMSALNMSVQLLPDSASGLSAGDSVTVSEWQYVRVIPSGYGEGYDGYSFDYFVDKSSKTQQGHFDSNSPQTPKDGENGQIIINDSQMSLESTIGSTIDLGLGISGAAAQKSLSTSLFIDIVISVTKKTTEKPDLAATPLTWNTTQGGVDFGYQVNDAALPKDTTAALYWASGTSEDTILEPAATPIPIPSSTPVGVPQTVHVAQQDLPGGPPPNAKYLLLELNPDKTVHESDEANDTNNVKAIPLPDIQVTKAYLSSPKELVFDYQVISPTSPDMTFQVGIYRSTTPTFDFSNPNQYPVIQADITASASQTEQTVDLPQAPSPDPSYPYILVVADPYNQVPEGDLSAASASAPVGKGNNTSYFHVYLLGVVTHGFEFGPQSMPQWVRDMAGSLALQGYASEIPFPWSPSGLTYAQMFKALFSPKSIHGDPGHVVEAARELAGKVQAAAEALAPNADQTGDVVDVHFIGHSRGASVIGEAIADLQNTSVAALKGSFIRETMLDPHPAKNFMTRDEALKLLKASTSVHASSYSLADQMSFTRSIKLHPGKTVAKRVLIYQDRTNDPAPQFPANVQAGDVYYQHTPANLLPSFPDNVINLWGNIAHIINNSPIGPIYHDLTLMHLSHDGVHDYYQTSVISTLWTSSDPWLNYDSAS
jgi:hypothetical protein